MPSLPRALLACALLAAGCNATGDVPPTQEPPFAAEGAGDEPVPLRTVTDMLLLSTAAERAVDRFDAQTLAGRRVLVDVSRFEPTERELVHSAFRDHITASGGVMVDVGASNHALDPPPGTDVVVEVRRGALGRYDSDFTLGIPPLPIVIPFFGAGLQTPGLYLFRHTRAKAYAKFGVFVYSARSGTQVGLRQELWGQAHFDQWFWVGIGPFDGSNDIYPPGDP